MTQKFSRAELDSLRGQQLNRIAAEKHAHKSDIELDTELKDLITLIARLKRKLRVAENRMAEIQGAQLHRAAERR